MDGPGSRRAFLKKLSKAALAIGAAIKATGAHRYRFRYSRLFTSAAGGPLVEVYRTDEHHFFIKAPSGWVKITPGVPVGGIRVVPSK